MISTRNMTGEKMFDDEQMTLLMSLQREMAEMKRKNEEEIQVLWKEKKTWRSSWLRGPLLAWARLNPKAPQNLPHFRLSKIPPHLGENESRLSEIPSRLSENGYENSPYFHCILSHERELFRQARGISPECYIKPGLNMFSQQFLHFNYIIIHINLFIQPY